MSIEKQIADMAVEIAEIRGAVKGNGIGLSEQVRGMSEQLGRNDIKTDALHNTMTAYLDNHPAVCPALDDEKRLKKTERLWKLWLVRGSMMSTSLGMIIVLLKVFGVIGG